MFERNENNYSIIVSGAPPGAKFADENFKLKHTGPVNHLHA